MFHKQYHFLIFHDYETRTMAEMFVFYLTVVLRLFSNHYAIFGKHQT